MTNPVLSWSDRWAEALAAWDLARDQVAAAEGRYVDVAIYRLRAAEALIAALWAEYRSAARTDLAD